MRKCDRYYAISCYRYAPESFKAMYIKGFSKGNRNIPLYAKIELTSEERSKCGNAFACKGRAAALEELKRIIRKREKENKVYCSYGFTFVSDPKQYIYTRQIRAKEDDIKEKLWAYKQVRKWGSDMGYKYTQFESGTLNAGMTFTKQDNTRELNRIPVVIHYIYDHNYGY